MNHHLDVPYRVLEKKYDFGDGGDKSGNKIIHGDNLEALKSLLPEYEGRIKCIYIDPPYNTGNENWVYNDNVNSPKIKKWLGQVVGKESEDLTRHDKWLCMMYPRLKLLQKLLSNDGAIFISIDDNEQANLKLVCDEIFGAGNFVDQFIWYVNDGHTDNQDDITVIHEYILCYAKKKNCLIANNIVDPSIESDSKILNTFAENSITKNGSKNPPSVITLKKGFPCEIQTLRKEKHPLVSELMRDADETGFITREMTKNYAISYPARLDDMIVQNGKLVEDCRVFSGWMNNGKLKKFMDEDFKPLEDNGSKLRFFLSKNGVVYYRRDGRETHYIQTVIEKIGTTETNKYMLESMGISFDFPKPYTLVSFLISIFSDKDSIVLDSFAGSGTTAHAVLNLNKQDGGNRKFILVEMEDYAETITAERVRRVIDGYGEDKNAVEGTGGSFAYYELGPELLKDGFINEEVPEQTIREYLYYTETNHALPQSNNGHPAHLGNFEGVAYYFVYSKDKTTSLDSKFLASISEKSERYVIYADNCILPQKFLFDHDITFKKIPRDIRRF
ncbi:MAG: site-specific DNA-methyltransferase [Fibrobacter intestinalis]|uniref:site-specific DNA-methyltransferase n=1 Tax=Fibrobacter intestinalis TaxID=28122 RepID=UPI003F06FA5A